MGCCHWRLGCCQAEFAHSTRNWFARGAKPAAIEGKPTGTSRLMGCVPMAGLAKITAQRAGMQSIKLRDLCSILCCSERSVAGLRHDRSLIRQETPRAPQSQKRALCRGARAGKVRPRWNRGWWGAEIQTNFARRALLRGKQDRIDAGDSEVSEAAATKPHHVLQVLRHGANGCA